MSRADDGGRSCRNGSAPTHSYHGRSAWRAEPWWQRILYRTDWMQPTSSNKPQTSAKLSYLARYCLFKALQYDLLDFWLAGGEGKRSSDAWKSTFAIVIACIQCKVGLAQQCLNFLRDPQGQA